MSRKSVMDGSPDAHLGELLAEVVYRPTDEARKLKARYYTRIADNPLVDPKEANLTDVQRVVGGTTINKLWHQPGFQEWFRNSSEFQEELEELAHEALAAAWDIIRSQDPKAQGARVQMIKLVMEMSGKGKKDAGNQGAAMASALIGKMDQAQLSLFLQKQGVNLSIEASKSPAAEPAQITLDIPSKT